MSSKALFYGNQNKLSFGVKGTVVQQGFVNSLPVNDLFAGYWIFKNYSPERLSC